MVPYSKHVGLWLILFAGVCGIASNIAALSGYSGRYTLELVVGCIAASLVVGAFSYRGANRKLAARTRQANGELQPNREWVKALSHQDFTKEQRVRWFFAWTVSAFVFAIIDFVVYQTMRYLFPDTMPEMVIVVALSISGLLATFFGVVFYQRASRS
jgi:FtsH-binding integral membrane protein